MLTNSNSVQYVDEFLIRHAASARGAYDRIYKRHGCTYLLA